MSSLSGRYCECAGAGTPRSLFPGGVWVYVEAQFHSFIHPFPRLCPSCFFPRFFPKALQAFSKFLWIGLEQILGLSYYAGESLYVLHLSQLLSDDWLEFTDLCLPDVAFHRSD